MERPGKEPSNVVDLHRATSIELLKDVPCFCTRTPKGQKDPGHLGWDPKTNSAENHKQNLHRLETGEDNVGIHLFGTVVDVDVDTDNPMLAEALEIFLPPTPHVWGRGERTRTHRLYNLTAMGETEFDPSQHRFLKQIADIPSLKVEIRGGAMRSGQYSLMPGSLHPSGDTYRWDNIAAARTTLVSVDSFRVTNAVRFACVSAAIAAYWTEGVRNQLCMALSGFLHRAAAHCEDMGAISDVYIDKDRALSILQAVMSIAGDDEADEQMRMRTFEQTWDKATEGHPVTGATTISKLTGDESLIPLLYSLLTDSPDLVALDKFFDKYAVRNNSSNVIDIDKAGSRGASYLMTVNDFRNSNMHMTITSSSGARVGMTNILLASTRAIRVDGFCFKPGQDRIVNRGDEARINQWRGYQIEPVTETVTVKDVAPFVEYVHEVLANENAEAYRWIISWFADMFQNPGQKCGTALVLVGRPGSGKSMIGEQVIRRIIGPNHSMQTNTIESLTNNFNADSSAMLFIQCDEAANTRRRSDANRLKSMITDPTRRVEPKGVDAYQIEDCARYFFTSNELDNAVAIVDGQHDRRYGVFRVNEKYSYSSKEVEPLEKSKFWDKIFAWLASEENLAKVAGYLSQYQYDPAFIRSPIDTEARRVLQQHSQRGLEEWLMQIAVMEHPFENLREKDQRTEESYLRRGSKLFPTLEDWPNLVSYRRLEDSYMYYRRSHQVASTAQVYNAQQIKQEFIRRGLLKSNPTTTRINHNEEVFRNGDIVTVTRKIRITDFPSREKIREYLRVNVGFEIDEDGDTDYEIETDSKKAEF